MMDSGMKSLALRSFLGVEVPCDEGCILMQSSKNVATFLLMKFKSSNENAKFTLSKKKKKKKCYQKFIQEACKSGIQNLLNKSGNQVLGFLFFFFFIKGHDVKIILKCTFVALIM